MDASRACGPWDPLRSEVRLYPLKQSFRLRLLLMHLVLSPLGLAGALHAREEGAFHPAVLRGLLDHSAGSSRQHRAKGTASGAGLGQYSPQGEGSWPWPWGLGPRSESAWLHNPRHRFPLR